LHVLVVTTASDSDPGSHTAFLHCSFICRHQIYISMSVVIWRNRYRQQGRKTTQLS